MVQSCVGFVNIQPRSIQKWIWAAAKPNFQLGGRQITFLGFPGAVREFSSRSGTLSRELRRAQNPHNRHKSLTSTHFGTSAGDRAFGREVPLLDKKHAKSALLATTHSCAVVLNSIGHLVEGAPAGPFFLLAGWRPPKLLYI